MQNCRSIGTMLLIISSILVGNSIAQQTSTTTPTPKTSIPAKSQQKSTTTKTTHATTASKPKPPVLTTQKDKQSYAIGLNVGKGMQRDAVEVDPKIFLQGLQDGLAGSKPLLTDDEIKATMIALQNNLRQNLLDTNKKKEQAFLADNKTKEGVVALPSGLQYKILKEGTGPKPSATDTVVCNYRGTLLDNNEFDSSYKRGQPATFGVGNVIKGWTEALQLMPVGSKWQLFIPADLAYGEQGKGPIAPNSTLIFEVELLSIKEKPAQPATPASPPAPQTPPAQSTQPPQQPK